jgi:hypothetical protein
MADLDLQWRLRTSNGYVWRLARIEDLLRVHQMWFEQEQRVGKAARLDLMKMPAVLTLVAENDAGEIVEALYGEATVEWASIGLERGALETVSELFPALERFCGERSVRLCRVNVPRRLAALVSRFIPGMKRIDREMAQFVFRIF